MKKLLCGSKMCASTTSSCALLVHAVPQTALYQSYSHELRFQAKGLKAQSRLEPLQAVSSKNISLACKNMQASSCLLEASVSDLLRGEVGREPVEGEGQDLDVW